MDIDKYCFSKRIKTVLPLTSENKKLCVKYLNSRTLKHEKWNIGRQALMSLLSLMYIGFVMLMDYIVFLLLQLYSGLNGARVEFTKPSVEVSTNTSPNFMTDFYQAIYELTTPYISSFPSYYELNCIRIARESNYDDYVVIASLWIICFLATILRTYLLRLRSVICMTCYPHRRTPRALWLHDQLRKNIRPKPILLRFPAFDLRRIVIV